MYCIERLDSDGHWTKEICFKTEFKAFVSARTKSRATLRTYRIVESHLESRGCGGQGSTLTCLTDGFAPS